MSVVDGVRILTLIKAMKWFDFIVGLVRILPQENVTAVIARPVLVRPPLQLDCKQDVISFDQSIKITLILLKYHNIGGD